MNAPVARWAVRLAAAAETDYAEIVRWTAQQFGLRQARTYAATLDAALAALITGPGVAGARRRSDIGPDLWSLHVARQRRTGRHVVIFRAPDGAAVIEVLRVLHDAMDLPRHLPAHGDMPEDDSPAGSVK